MASKIIYSEKGVKTHNLPDLDLSGKIVVDSVIKNDLLSILQRFMTDKKFEKMNSFVQDYIYGIEHNVKTLEIDMKELMAIIIVNTGNLMAIMDSKIKDYKYLSLLGSEISNYFNLLTASVEAGEKKKILSLNGK